MSNDGKHIVRQDISGNGHQIAGRDLINEGDGFKPDPNNTNLRKCDYCGWPGLARDAHTCSKCGHSYLADHLVRQKRALQETEKLKVLLMGLLALSLFGSLQLSDWFGLDLFEGIVTTLAIMACLWFVAIRIRVHFECWWAKRNRRGDE